MKKAFRGKDALVNFLFENNMWDKVMQNSVEVDNDQYQKFVKQVNKDFKDNFGRSVRKQQQEEAFQTENQPKV